MQWSMEVGPDDKAAVVFPITHVGGLMLFFHATSVWAVLAFKPGKWVYKQSESRKVF